MSSPTSRPAGRLVGTLALLVVVAAITVGGGAVMLAEGGLFVLPGLLLPLLGLLGLAVVVPTPMPMLVGLLGLVVVFALFGVTLIAAMLTSPSTGALLPVVLVAGLLVVTAPLALRAVRGRYRRGGLRLGPEAVGYASYQSLRTVGWDDLREVVLVTDPGPRVLLRARSAEAVRREGGPRSAVEQHAGGPATAADEVSISLAMLAGEARLIIAAIEHYREHPEHRSELGTPAALERLCDGRGLPA